MASNINVRINARGKATVNVNIRTTKSDRKPLRFGHGNAKLDAAVFTFSLPAGHFCPFAKDCKAKADKDTGRIQDGPDTEFRCYAASMEARHRSVRNSRWGNVEQLLACKNKEEMVHLILDSLSAFAGYVRIHDSGDFFSQDYFDAWIEVARRRPRTIFYWYSKSIRYWLDRLDEVGDGHTPGSVENIVPTASYGGRDDSFIAEHGLRSARVVLSQEEANELGLVIDHDDSHAMTHGPDFCLLIHGTQPAGTPAAKAVASLRAQGEFGYGEKADDVRVRNGRMPLAVV